ncbi:MAG: hypothetical protein JO102_00890, partial [Elusimicrobia bacterium]|nr:hypothetical protein [Elusimicrobiota bacterium]
MIDKRRRQISAPTLSLPFVPPWIVSAFAGATLAAFLFTHTAPKPIPVPAAVTVEDRGWDRMVSAITDRMANFDGEVGIYIKDLHTGRVYRHNADHHFVTASLIKLPIM